MAVTAMSGVVGWAAQESKSTEVGYVAPTTWYRHKATLVDLAVQDDVRLGVPEVGGVPVPTFPYKAGVLVGGGVTIQPRLESTLGWLLYGMLGDKTTTQQGTTDAYDHVFKFLAADASATKWFSFRKHIPRRENVATTDLGEVYTDCKIMGMTMTLPNDAPVTTRVDVLGRKFQLDHAPDAWTWANTFEGFGSIPVGCNTSGYVKMPDYSASELPIMAGSVTFQNVPLDLRQDRVYGDAYLEDITVVMRQLTFDLVLKWNNPDLYASMLTGASNGNNWTSEVFTSDLEIMIVAPEVIGDTQVPYSLKIVANKVMLSMPEGIQLAGGQAIMTRVTGTALEPTAGEYVEFTLTNGETSYTWPT